jgi:hypothetical protein
MPDGSHEHFTSVNRRVHYHRNKLGNLKSNHVVVKREKRDL